MSSLSPTESSFIGRKPALYVSIFFLINFAKQVKGHQKKKVYIYSQEYRRGHRHSERQLLRAQDTDR